METLADLPEIEYLDGVGYAKTSPKLAHFLVQGALVEILRRNGRAYGYVGAELRCRVGAVDGTSTQLVPDVAFISRGRLLELDGVERSEPPFAPDIAIEVGSPSDRPGLRASKIARYLATGSVLVLDVDPATYTIAAHAIDGMRMFVAGERFEHATAPWLMFDVAYVFEDLED